jgi:N-acetylneuraminic acid mutarotase
MRSAAYLMGDVLPTLHLVFNVHAHASLGRLTVTRLILVFGLMLAIVSCGNEGGSSTESERSISTGSEGGSSTVIEVGTSTGSGGGNSTTYAVGGVVTGLADGSSIVLNDNGDSARIAIGAANIGAKSVAVARDGPFLFPVKVRDDSPFDISIQAPPSGKACAVIHGKDKVRGDDVNHINVYCGPLPTGVWTYGANIGTGRTSHTAILLANGKLLVAGGFDSAASSGEVFLNSAELYDSATKSWSPTGSLATRRYYHTATLLRSGKVLVVGGYNNPIPLSSAELYDPETHSWSSAGDMGIARLHHTATLLRDGKVLVVGGTDVATVTASAQIYNPATNKWSAVATLGTARAHHSATLLPNGKVLVAGGSIGTPSLMSAELYDPKFDAWSTTGNLATARADHSANLLPNGKVLVAGGFKEVTGTFNAQEAVASAELYDPQVGVWSSAGQLSAARNGHASITTLLPTSRVMVAGGGNPNANFATVELYDPASNTWLPTGSLAKPRRNHTATLLPNGRIIVVGGASNEVNLTTEIY